MSQKEKVLEMLLQGPKTTADFLQAYIPRFSARIQDLRDEGIAVETELVRRGSYRYFLKGYQQKKQFEGGLF